MTSKSFVVAPRNLCVAAGIFVTSIVYSQENVSYTESQAAAGQLTYEEALRDLSWLQPRGL